MTGSLMCLNEEGHVTLAWTANRDAEAIEGIKKMMKKGYSFWELEEHIETQPPLAVEAIETTVTTGHKISIKDADLKAMIEVGLLAFTPKGKARTSSKAKRRIDDPAEVVGKETAVMRPRGPG